MAADNEKLSWVELRQSIAKQSGISQKETTQFLNSLIEQLTLALQHGESIRISGLGTFHTQTMAPRKSVNVATGENITIPSYNKLSFTLENTTKERMNGRASLTPASDPMQKLNEQANEILDILADMGQHPTTKATQEPITEENKEETTVEVVAEETPIEVEAEDTTKEIATPEQEMSPIIADEEPIPNESIKPLPVVDIQSPTRNKPFRPWLAAGITMSIFCLLLIGGYLFLQHKLEQWVNHLQEKIEASSNEPSYIGVLDDDTTLYEQNDILNTEDLEELEATTDCVNDSSTSPEPETVVKTNSIEASAKEQVVASDDNNTRIYTEFITTEILPQDSRLAWVAKKYYGEKKLWVFIYEANLDHLNNPSCIQPGTPIRIPKLNDKLRDINNPETVQIIQELENKFLNK